MAAVLCGKNFCELFSFFYLVDKGRFEADIQCNPVVAVAAAVDGRVLLGHLEGDPSQA